MTGNSTMLLLQENRVERVLPRVANPRKKSGAGWKQVQLIAKKEFSDRFRSGWVIACVAVWLGAIGLTSLFGQVQIGHIGVQGYERTVVSLLSVVQYLVPLLALLLGHDLVVSDNEERTLRLVLAAGVTRSRLLLGKWIGGVLTVSVPLALGFAIAGTVIGLTARDQAIAPFARLAVSGLGLGIVFVGMGLLISTLCRTRLQSLVLALLVWCCAVFVFDLVALGVLIMSKSPVAAQEIDLLCDTTHINTAADVHQGYDAIAGPDASRDPSRASAGSSSSLGWLMLNPIDLFRTFNLSKSLDLSIPATGALLAFISWIACPLGLGLWKFRRTDL